ncbi:MAG: hypothetical protein LUQ54_07240 [Methanoregula sp.]|nr:hypothetical protein [Methanoregula sp.]
MNTGFGWIESEGIRYEHDIVIHTDRSITKRNKKLSKKRKEEFGHTPLSGEELIDLLKEHPEVVYIGTGQFGDLPLTSDAVTRLAHVVTVMKPTPDILFEIASEHRKYAAILHVTC